MNYHYSMLMHHLMVDYENEMVEKQTSFLMRKQRQQQQQQQQLKMDE
jgi:hypothetical protein